MVIDHKGYDPTTTRGPGEVIILERKDASDPWTIDNSRGQGDQHRDPAQPLHRPRRPQDRGDPAQARRADRRPEGGPGEVKPTTRQAWLSLVNKGFYLTRDGLFSNKGRSRSPPTRGWSTPSASARPSSPPATSSPPGPSPTSRPRPWARRSGGEATSEGRYLFVTAAFDPAYPPAEALTRRRQVPRRPLRLRGRRQADRRREPARQGEGREAQGRPRPADRRRPEEGQGAERPLRRLVLRHPRRQLPDDRPGPGPTSSGTSRSRPTNPPRRPSRLPRRLPGAPGLPFNPLGN